MLVSAVCVMKDCLLAIEFRISEEADLKRILTILKDRSARLWGDYWILGLGSDYEYAVVGSPDRKYGWILSRDPHPDPRIIEEARSVLREQGFDPDRFLLGARP